MESLYATETIARVAQVEDIDAASSRSRQLYKRAQDVDPVQVPLWFENVAAMTTNQPTSTALYKSPL